MHSFDGHNDVLLRLWRQGNDGVAAFLKGDGKGQLDLPRAREGGMVGGALCHLRSFRAQVSSQ